MLEKMQKTSIDLDRTLKVVGKVFGVAQSVDEHPSQRFTDEIEATSRFMENGEHISGELNWLLKFKKLKNGEKMTVHNCKGLQHQAAKALAELVDTAKSLKALIPK